MTKSSRYSPGEKPTSNRPNCSATRRRMLACTATLEPCCQPCVLSKVISIICGIWSRIRARDQCPLLSCCEKLILMASHKDVGLWTCQDDSWLLLWVWKAEDRSVGAIERNERLLFLRDA